MFAGIMPDFENFDPDEMFLLIGSGVACIVGAMYWLLRLRPVSKLGAQPHHRTPFYLAALTGFVVLGIVVWRWADPQIRDNSGYVLLVFLMGGACLTIANALLPWLGISLRDDAFERRNFAAVLAFSGAALGVMVTYSAATVGTGPSFWNNVFSSLLATGTLLLVWLMVAVFGRAAVSIAEERDIASGLRLGALLMGEGFILGRAVAGNWVSAEATVRDFLRDGWPALALCVAAIIVEWMLRPTRGKPQPPVTTHGVVPGLGYLLAALAWCGYLGWWEGLPE
jgi:uncharacterized membrane protein YjfL (UPF0719 family)